MAERYPIISQEHDTDRIANALVDVWLASTYLVRRLPLDYGLDGLLEPKKERHASGEMVLFQLKGTRGLRFDEHGRCPWSLETKHLRWYRDLSPLPVFLLVVDVDGGTGFFCDLQPQIARLGQKIDDQESATVDLSLGCSLRESAGFYTAIKNARAAFIGRQPGALEAVFAAIVEAHALIDPNFTVVSAEVTATGKTVTLAPRRDFSFSMSLKGGNSSPAAEKLRNLFKYGENLEITSNEADFHGLPLFEWAKKKGLVGVFVFKPANVFDCDVVLSAPAPHAFSLTLRGKLSGGENGLLITAAIPKAPLRLHLRIPRKAMEGRGSTTITVGFELEKWQGADLRRLPWVAQITNLWRTLFAAQKIGVEIVSDGNYLTRGHMGGGTPRSPFDSYASLSELLLKAHELAVAYNVALPVPEFDNITTSDVSDIESAHALHTTGKYLAPSPNMRLRMEPEPGNVKLEELRQQRMPVTGWARLEQDPYFVTIFGVRFAMPPAAMEFGPVIFQAVDGDAAAIDLIGDATTRTYLTRLEPGSATASSVPA